MSARFGCELCERPGGHLIHRAARWRVIRADDGDFPAFYRVVWNAHAVEFTDLSQPDRRRLMDVVAGVEAVLRAALQPTKINLASLGNMVAHLHWHVIARFEWDSRYPQPVWSPVQRSVEPPASSRLATALPVLDARVAEAVAVLGDD